MMFICIIQRLNLWKNSNQNIREQSSGRTFSFSTIIYPYNQGIHVVQLFMIVLILVMQVLM
jgi:hypothetical protein